MSPISQNAPRLPYRGVVYCSCVDWGSHWERMHHLAWLLAHDVPVLYVDNPGVRPLRWDHLPRIVGRLQRAFLKTPSGPTPHADRLLPNLHRLGPLLIPSPTQPGMMRLNRKLLRQQVATALARAGMEADLLWVSSPTDPVVGLLDAFPWKTVLYDCVDDLPALHPYRAAQLQAGESAVLARADHVLVTAHALEAKLRSLGRGEAHYIPNGIEMDRFAKIGPTPAAMRALPWPVIGFLGSMLPNVFDVDLVIAIAKQRPEWSVALVGPVPPAWQARLAGTRVHALGPAGYRDAAAYLQAFDVGIVPFLENGLTRAINPLKVYEYLACGLPVVSTPLPELDAFGDLVRQAAGPDAIIEAIDAALAEGDQRAAARRAEAARHSWTRRYDAIIGILTSRR